DAKVVHRANEVVEQTARGGRQPGDPVSRAIELADEGPGTAQRGERLTGQVDVGAEHEVVIRELPHLGEVLDAVHDVEPTLVVGKRRCRDRRYVLRSRTQHRTQAGLVPVPDVVEVPATVLEEGLGPHLGERYGRALPVVRRRCVRQRLDTHRYGGTGVVVV